MDLGMSSMFQAWTSPPSSAVPKPIIAPGQNKTPAKRAANAEAYVDMSTARSESHASSSESSILGIGTALFGVIGGAIETVVGSSSSAHETPLVIKTIDDVYNDYDDDSIFSDETLSTSSENGFDNNSDGTGNKTPRQARKAVGSKSVTFTNEDSARANNSEPAELQGCMSNNIEAIEMLTGSILLPNGIPSPTSVNGIYWFVRSLSDENVTLIPLEDCHSVLGEIRLYDLTLDTPLEQDGSLFEDRPLHGTHVNGMASNLGAVAVKEESTLSSNRRRTRSDSSVFEGLSEEVTADRYGEPLGGTPQGEKRSRLNSLEAAFVTPNRRKEDFESMRRKLQQLEEANRILSDEIEFLATTPTSSIIKSRLAEMRYKENVSLAEDCNTNILGIAVRFQKMKALGSQRSHRSIMIIYPESTIKADPEGSRPYNIFLNGVRSCVRKGCSDDVLEYWYDIGMPDPEFIRLGADKNLSYQVMNPMAISFTGTDIGICRCVHTASMLLTPYFGSRHHCLVQKEIPRHVVIFSVHRWLHQKRPVVVKGMRITVTLMK